MSVVLESRHIEQMIEAVQPQRRAVQGRLAHLRLALRSHLLIAGLMRCVALIVALAAASLLVDRLLRLETSSRLALSLVAIALIGVAVWRWIVTPLRLRFDDLDLAELVERRRRGVGQCIVDVLQLPDLLGSPEFASPTLVCAAVRDHAQQLEQVDFGGLVDYRRYLRNSMLLGCVLIIPVVFAIAWPQTAKLWARRWLLAENIRWPQDTYLALDGLAERDSLLTARGEPLVLQLSAQPAFTQTDGGWKLGGRGQDLIVETDQAPQSTIPEQIDIYYRLPGGTSKQATFTRFEGANFRYELPPLVDPVEVTITGGDDWIGPVRIEPIERPSAADLKLVARLPGSTDDEIHAVGNTEEPLMFLPETKLELQLASSEPLRLAEVLAKDETPQTMEQVDPKGFRISWTMKQTQTLELRLISAISGLASKPYFLTIGLLNDREPRLTLRSSGVGRRVTPQARIPLSLHAADDFGLANLGLELEKTDPSGEKPVVTAKQWEMEKFADDKAASLPLSIDRDFEMKATEHSLAAGQNVRLRASAIDRCALGSHTGNSRWLSFQIVTPEELFYEILIRQREQRTKFAAATVQAQAQAQALAKLDTLDGVAPLVRTHQTIARQVSQIANKLDVALREMTLNDLSNTTARQLLADNVIAPMRELHSGPFEQLRTRLDQLAAGEEIDHDQRDAALETQQQIVHSMQTILERMAQWESFVDVVNQLRAIIKLQTTLKKGTEEAQQKQTNDLFDE